jgi:hypothetical protein
MIELAPLFKNFYDDRQHSIEELLRYGAKLLILLSANNPANALDTVIAEVSGAYTAFVGCVGDEEAKAALREAANLSRNNLKKGMSGTNGAVSRAASAVAGAYGKKSADYTACFPLGVEGITGAPLALMEERLENLRLALVARQANVAIAPHVTTITALKAAWHSLHEDAGQATGEESEQEEHRRACRTAVTKAFTRSALWLAWHFNGDESKYSLYLPVHLLKNAVAQPPGTATLAVEPGVGLATFTGDASNADVMKYFYRLAGAPDWTAGVTGAPGAPVMQGSLPTGNYEFMCRGANDEGDGPESDVVTGEVT